MFIARQSDHIEEDIKRNWSSWNFGQEGFEGTREELNEAIDQITDSSPLCISGFELYPDFVNDFEFGELYENYWVVIDRVNASNGISGIELDAKVLEEAIKESTNRNDYFGDGISFDTSKAKLVKSIDDIHIFEVDEF